MIVMMPGDILTSDAEAIVIPVSCDGAGGSIIFSLARRSYPENLKKYKNACALGELKVGDTLITEGNGPRDKIIINLPIKARKNDKPSLRHIRLAMKALVKATRDRKINSVAIPMLGCDRIGLDPAEVLPIIVAGESQIEHVEFQIYSESPKPDKVRHSDKDKSNRENKKVQQPSPGQRQVNNQRAHKNGQRKEVGPANNPHAQGRKSASREGNQRRNRKKECRSK